METNFSSQSPVQAKAQSDPSEKCNV